MNELEKVIPRQHEIAGLERKLQHHRWKSRVTLPPEKKKHKLDDTLVAKGETTNDMQNKSRFSRSQTVKLHSGQEHRKKSVRREAFDLKDLEFAVGRYEKPIKPPREWLALCRHSHFNEDYTPALQTFCKGYANIPGYLLHQ
ncbi:hypothetical protein RUM44_007260 [Polyplax serrata]|uniref:Uncharacterized protein n=1 Tax=Polyplax serrata TaxID=468196 RepID=A0ABR1B078_POLSC